VKRSLSEVPFAALLAYSRIGTSKVAARSRMVRDAVKQGHAATLARAIDHLRGVDVDLIARYFGPDITLVPTPRSAPLADAHSLWPALAICNALVQNGFGNQVVPCVRRTLAVPKSAFAVGVDRPKVEHHLATLAVDDGLFAPSQITVVDDFVTAGRMLFATCCAVQARFPDAEVRAFALVRTRNLVPDIDRIVDPCEGTIRWNETRGDVDRAP
jgi:hypothetical protein